MMTKTERVYAAIARRRADRVPKGEWHLSPGLIAGILGSQGSIGWEEEAAVREFLGMDLVVLGTSAVHHGPEPNYDSIRRWRAETDFFVFALIDGPFQGTVQQMDFVDFLLRLGRGDERIRKLAAEQAERGLAMARQCLRNGAHGVLLADDVAYTRGLFVQPLLMREIFVPLWRYQVQALKNEKVPVFFHSDGNINSLLPDLVAAGFNGLHSLEPTANMDIARIKKEYGHSLCLMGNIDLGFLIQAGQKEIEAEVKQLMTTAALGGGFIFSTSCGCLGDDVPPDKVIALYRSAEKYGFYEKYKCPE
ncbi:MAG: uroporphyrinogen decarboxylase family protein [Bacillota bacterium]|nr:hypothetical protein [Bacillota bacterium]